MTTKDSCPVLGHEHAAVTELETWQLEAVEGGSLLGDAARGLGYLYGCYLKSFSDSEPSLYTF